MDPQDVVRASIVALAVTVAGCSAPFAPSGETDARTGTRPDAATAAPGPDAAVDTGTSSALACLSGPRSAAIIRYTDPDHPDPDCTAAGPYGIGPQPLVTRSARVTAIAGDAYHASLSLDFCGPGPCDAVPGELHVDDAGLDLSNGTVPIRAGQFVEIRWQVFTLHGINGCGRAVEVRNLAAWNDVPNPVRDDGAILFFAQTDGHGLFDTTALSGREVSIGCQGAHHDCNMGPEEAFAEAFSAGGPEALLHEGESGTIALDGRSYEIHLLSAYISGYCDDSGTYSWSLRELGPDTTM